VASDLLISDLEALRHDPEFASRYREAPRLSTYYLLFNIHRGPLADEQLRKQIVQTIDVEGLVRRNVGRIGIAAHGYIPPGLLGYEPGKVLVPTQEKGFKHVELSCLVNHVYEGHYLPVKQELFDSFQKKGFDIRTMEMKVEDFNKAMNVAPSDLVLERWIADYPDADNFVGLLHSEKGFIGRYCGTPEVDSLIERGRMETRPEMRHDIYREIEQIIARRALLLPLFHEKTYRFARPEVEGFEIRLSYPAVPYEKLWIRR